MLMRILIPIFVLLTTLCSCSAPSETDTIRISKASATSLLPPKTDQAFAFIYNYNSVRSKLEWKAYKVVETSDNQLVDAINTFIHQNQIKGFCPELELEPIEASQLPVQLKLSGIPTFKTQRDSTIFWTALDMTIQRNAEDTPYRINIE